MSVTRRELLGAALLRGAAPVLLPGVAASAAEAKRARYVPITLLLTNDVHGRILLPGQPQGLARLATLVRQVRAEMPNVVLLDAGDIIHGTSEEKAFAGRSSLSAMNALGYDAATAGNHEFDFGQIVTRNAIAFARFPVLSANVVDEKSGQPWGGLKPHIILERDGVRIGVFGLTTPTTVGIQWPRTLAGIRFADPIAAARAQVEALRTTGRAEVVVCLSHLGYGPDRELAKAVSGMDVILGGHSHTRLEEQVWVNNTLIMQTGALGNALGRVDLIARTGEGEMPGRVTLINGRDGRWWGSKGIPAPMNRTYPAQPLYSLTELVKEDAAVVAAYRPFANRLRPVLDETLTTAAEPLPATDATKRETAIGNLLADAVRTQAKTDIGIAASGQIAPAGLAAGAVTVRDLYALMGAYTRQHLVTARTPGAHLREMMRRALEGDKFQLHVSGLRIGENDAITVGGQPLSETRLYTVAGAAHLIQDYLLGREGVVVLNDDVQAPTLRDAAIAYLRGHAPLNNRVEPRIATGALSVSLPKSG